MNDVLRQQLLYYLSIYLKKKLNMEIILVNMFDRLKDGHSITEKQFRSLIKFLEREDQFLNKSRPQIRQYFSPIISNKVVSKRKEDYGTSTLCEFLQ